LTDETNDPNRYITMRNAPEGTRIDLADRAAVDRAIATANRAADFTEGRGDVRNPQGAQDAAGLELKLATKMAQRNYYTSQGLTPPDWLTQEVNSVSKSLAFQHERNGAVARGEVTVDNVPAPDDVAVQQMEDVYKANLATAVRGMQKQYPDMSMVQAEDKVIQLIAVKGIDAILPQYARVARRYGVIT
jgi:hypothetical protein